MTTDHRDVLADSLDRLERIADELDLPREVVEQLSHPKRTLTASLSVRRDDGSASYFTAFRCQYNDALGPTKGGIRFHPEASVEEVQALAFWMALKCAVAGLPFGGGKGAVVVDPKSLSRLELERLARAYVRAVADFIGPDVDVPAPDMYTNERIMGWMADEYQVIRRSRAPAVITGKPQCLGGSAGREEATGRGAFLVIREMARRRDVDLEGARVAVQGFGNAGYHVARLLERAGARIVAVSDSRGGVFSEDGFDIESLYRVKQDEGEVKGVYCDGSVCDLVEHDRIDNQEILELDVDILVPAAVGSVIAPSNAERVRASVVAEVANGPVTSEADPILEERGVFVLPDILTNAGGVTVSYFEWLQNRNGEHWSLDEVRSRLEEKMLASCGSVWETAEEAGIPLRSAAYRVAVERIGAAIRAHGTREYFNPR